MTKKRFISVIIVLSVLTSILMLGVTSASAVSKPTLYAPTNIKGGQRVTWSHAGASRYYLYFGVYDYKTQKPQWRVYREVKGTSYDINYTSLHSSGWKKYVYYTPTSNLTSGQVYCYQVHAGNINASHRQKLFKRADNDLSACSIPQLRDRRQSNCAWRLRAGSERLSVPLQKRELERISLCRKHYAELC